ncbi:amidohydrolase family protein [Rhizobium sp. CF142]|uniref:amidohydrolase family protein n=1 Tax=Rhizobium sp. CF142 TaxID=1144314 RepID=UPI00026EEB03|nr:amidohydrolase family protein [Rhizobium sp. CF142]EJJ31515.1 putative TIM-barrel fold metal-dependent hydrolase [Rhizobium sp. CF142]
MLARKLIDSHVHLFDHSAVSYSWMPSRGKILTEPHLPEHLLGSGLKAEIEGMVFVEAHSDGDAFLAEASFGQHLMDTDPKVVAIVADAPVERGAAVKGDLEALSRHRGLRGIRRFPGNPGRSLDEDFLAGVRLVGRFGLSFEFGIQHWALPYALEIARRCPEVSFALNHIALPDIKHDLREPWWSLIGQMGALPNVVCKISGAIAGADPVDWKPEQLRPYVVRAINAFGVERCMFGSDWPVSDLTHHYDAWVGVVEDALSGTSEAEKDSVFRGNATRHYRLTSPS